MSKLEVALIVVCMLQLAVFASLSMWRARYTEPKNPEHSLSYTSVGYQMLEVSSLNEIAARGAGKVNPPPRGP